MLTATAVLLVITWHFAFGLSLDKPGYEYNKKENAVWIKHYWVDTDYDWKQIGALVNKFEDNQIKHVYIHAGPVEPDGTVPDYKYIYAQSFLQKAKALNPDIEYYAWLGQLRHKIDLDNEYVRQNVINLSKQMTEDIGFDGIHFDFEGLADFDEGFIRLVVDTNKELTAKKLSVALEEYIPPTFAWILQNFVEIKDQLSAETFKVVSNNVDHIVIMPYDTGVQDAWLYTWLVKQEVIAITNLLPEGRILIGVPTYADQRPSFNPDAENMVSGIQGVIDGLNTKRTNQDSFTGVAIYANWETSDAEWRSYRKHWLTPETQSLPK